MPGIEPEPPAWQQASARLVHLGLYVLMIAMPLAGWLALSAAGKPIPFFGLHLPALIGKNKELADFIKEIHAIGAEIGYYLMVYVSLRFCFITISNTIISSCSKVF